jgi:CRP/FNR family transcriptional regulator, cyclic AMP receptor protein
VTPWKRKKDAFDPKLFLAHIGRGRSIVSFSKGRTVFAQGDSGDAVFCIQSGKVKLTVVSKTGKEATIAILGVGDFFGEDSLARHRLVGIVVNENMSAAKTNRVRADSP